MKAILKAVFLITNILALRNLPLEDSFEENAIFEETSFWNS